MGPSSSGWAASRRCTTLTTSSTATPTSFPLIWAEVHGSPDRPVASLDPGDRGILGHGSALGRPEVHCPVTRCRDLGGGALLGQCGRTGPPSSVDDALDRHVDALLVRQHGGLRRVGVGTGTPGLATQTTGARNMPGSTSVSFAAISPESPNDR